MGRRVHRLRFPNRLWWHEQRVPRRSIAAVAAAAAPAAPSTAVAASFPSSAVAAASVAAAAVAAAAPAHSAAIASSSEPAAAVAAASEPSSPIAFVLLKPPDFKMASKNFIHPIPALIRTKRGRASSTICPAASTWLLGLTALGSRGLLASLRGVGGTRSLFAKVSKFVDAIGARGARNRVDSPLTGDFPVVADFSNSSPVAP